MLPARLPFALVVLAALGAALTEGRAAPLDAESCAKLKVEHGQLEDAGVEQDMAKGAEWAKANLGLEKLQRVQRFIELEEQLLFRCRSKTIVSLTPDKDQDDDKDDNDDKDGKDDTAKAGAGQAKAADPKQKQQPAGKPAATPRKQEPAKSPKPSAKAAAREPAEPGVTSIEKRPPKAKVDDAYKAPPPDPLVDPFANQLTPSPGK